VVACVDVSDTHAFHAESIRPCDAVAAIRLGTDAHVPSLFTPVSLSLSLSLSLTASVSTSRSSDLPAVSRMGRAGAAVPD